MNRNLVLATLNCFIGMVLCLLVSWWLITWLMKVGTKWHPDVQILVAIVALLVASVPLMFGAAGAEGYVRRYIAQKEQLAGGKS